MCDVCVFSVALRAVPPQYLAARGMANVHVVHVNWLFDCIRHFVRLPEARYQELAAERAVDKYALALMEQFAHSYLNRSVAALAPTVPCVTTQAPNSVARSKDSSEGNEGSAEDIDPLSLMEECQFDDDADDDVDAE